MRNKDDGSLVMVACLKCGVVRWDKMEEFESRGRICEGCYKADKKQPEIVLCKDCKYFEHMPYGFTINICHKWAKGCQTEDDGYCYLAEKRSE